MKKDNKGEHGFMDRGRILVFDWGDTLMVEYPDEQGPMALWSRVAPMAGVMTSIVAVARKYPCYVAANAGNSTAEQVKQALARIGIARFFQGFYTHRELGAKKPSKDFFEHLAQELGSPCEEVIYIGNDYDRDIVPAKLAGMTTIYVSGTEGMYPSADVRIASMWELPEHLMNR